MDFEFKCQGSNGATMSSYSYLREPSLQDSGYTRGLKAGSFNYLENGDINLAERIIYKYGNGTSKANTSYGHEMSLDFMGEKGISEFYGKEYFKNNRAISAWKKIRYEDIDESYLNLGKKNLAKNINVRADLSMDTTPGLGYNLKYNATVKGGVIETWDASGWSNRTGSRRTDWEHNAMMYGDVSVVNNLKESAPLVAHAGGEDWLPCCYSGTQPAVEQLNHPWPSQIVIKMLEADKIIPTKDCYGVVQKCIENGTWKTDKCKIPDSCRNASCSEGNCPGYDCVYTYNQGYGQGGLPGGDFYYNGTTKGLFLEHTYQETTGKQVVYDITIKNSGDIRITDISVVDTLPANMAYVRSSYLFEEDGTLEEPAKSTNAEGTTLTWSIDDLVSDQSKTIQLMVTYTGDASGASRAKAIASGSALGNPVETSPVEAQEDIGSLG